MASRFLSTLPDAPAVLRRMSLRAPFATGRVAPDLGVVSPRDALGNLLGLGGSLRLAEHLASPRQAPGAAARPRPEIARFVGDRTSAIRLEAISSLAAPHAGTHSVPDAAALASALAAAQALGNRQRRRWEKAGKTLGPKYARPFGAVVAQARKKIGWVRADAIAMLRAGPHDEDLVALDLVYHASIEPGVQRALVRAEASLASYFVESLVAAGKRLEPSAGPSDIALWLERAGWIEVFLRNLGDLAIAIIDREIDAVRALVEGALATSVREHAP